MKRSLLMKFSLLSISLVLTSAAAVSGAIPLMMEQFHHLSLESVELLTTAPAISVLIFVLLSVPIARKIGAKTTVIIGLITALIGGIFPMFTNSFTLVLLSRVVLGAGFGLFNSLAFALINDFFTGDERVAMIGYQSAFQGAGGALMTFAAGQLLVYGWHMAFAVYLIMIPILFLFISFVPKPPKIQAKTGEKQEVPKGILKYFIVFVIILALYSAIAIKLPNLLVSKGLGDGTSSSMIFTLAQIFGMIAGIIFGKVYSIFKNTTLPGSVLMMALGYYMIALSNSMIVITIGSVLVGISFCFMTPYLFNRAAEIANAGSQNLAASIMIAAAQIGGFFSPFLLNPLSEIPFLSNSFAQCFLSAAVILTVMAVIIWIVQKQRTARSKQTVR